MLQKKQISPYQNREFELKMELDAAQVRHLRQSPILTELAESPARTLKLRSMYYDTPHGSLRAAGIALRLRRADRRWIQTVKKADRPMAQGLSQPVEDECVVPGQALSLGLIADDDLREEVIGIARDGLEIVAETEFRRTAQMVRAPTGGLVEVAIDSGKAKAAGRETAFTELELELAEGDAGDLYALAAVLMPEGPARFSTLSKSERALALAEPGRSPSLVRKAARVDLRDRISVEGAASAILSEGLAHYVANMPVLLETDDPGGPHQVRVALRRLRSALSAFRMGLGREALQPWSDHARSIATEAGRLRDLDVLGSQLVAPMAIAHPSEPGFLALEQAIANRRAVIAEDVRVNLRGAETTGFGYGFSRFLAMRGWLNPADHDQTDRLAADAVPFASKVLDKRWKVVRALGNRIEELSIEERHDLRKELKKLRYLVDGFRSLFDPEDAKVFMKLIKRAQTAFGALNDAAMAEAILTARDAPGSDDASAARAAGRVIGHLLAEADHQWPDAVTGWHSLKKAGPFWRNRQRGKTVG